MSLVTRVLMGFFALLGVFVAPAAAHAAVHTVSLGESLYTISLDYGISLDKLMEANGIWDSLIYPGQKIYVPDSASGNGSSYTVREGDSLYYIGRRFGMDYRDLMAANGLSGTEIYPGMSLYIPAGQVSRGGHFGRYDPREVDLLARLITAEADGEPYEGKVAVGAVVLNRLTSTDFPNSISDVIYEYGDGTYQFEPVMNGWIERPASAESIKAAWDALKGWDPTNGAVYFFATYVDNPWLWARTLSKIIGDVAFTY